MKDHHFNPVYPVGQNAPKVSIGLPVYNGENFLSQALDSILGQTFENFELILSDNGSEDSTPDICIRYARTDSRIKYFRAKTNQGAAHNFNFVARKAEGTYFKWAAHDDLCAPQYLERCVERLDADPTIALCHTLSHCIDETGNVVSILKRDRGFDGDTPAKRFHALVNKRHMCVTIFGLFRRELLLETPLLQAYSTSDRNLLAEIGLLGKIHVIEEILFARRDHPQTSVRQFVKDNDGWVTWFDPSAKVGIHTPTIKAAREYLNSIEKVDLPPEEKRQCKLVLQDWIQNGLNYRGQPVKRLIDAESNKIQAARAGEMKNG